MTLDAWLTGNPDRAKTFHAAIGCTTMALIRYRNASKPPTERAGAARIPKEAIMRSIYVESDGAVDANGFYHFSEIEAAASSRLNDGRPGSSCPASMG